MDESELAELLIKRVLRNKYIPHIPTVKQSVFLSLVDLEALYGGAAGGGKSDALLMAALMFVDEPGYNAIIFRKTFSDLNLPEAIMTRSHEWLRGTDATWNGKDYRWTFPSGATLSFGYLNHANDRFRYQSSAFQFIGFDELTQFPSNNYLYLFSRLRRLEGSELPLRMRGATNPGGLGHDWVMERFIVDNERPFIPALIKDNPHIDAKSYERSLIELDDVTRQQLEYGLWIKPNEGQPFLRDWFRGQNRFHFDNISGIPIGRWQSWDTALTNKKESAYSAIVTGELTNAYHLRIMSAWQGKPIFPELPTVIADEAKKWNHDDMLRGVIIEGQASGKPAIQTLRASSDLWLSKRIIEFIPKGSKLERANRAAVWVKRGLVQLPFPHESVPWLDMFEKQLFGFPNTPFVDLVDSFSQLVIFLENFLITAWHGMQQKEQPKHKDSRVVRALKKQNKRY